MGRLGIPSLTQSKSAAYAARAATDTQRSDRFDRAVTAPSSMAHRLLGAGVQTPLAGVRALAPNQVQYLQRTLGNHQLGAVLRRAQGISSPVGQSALAEVEGRLGRRSRQGAELVARSVHAPDTASRQRLLAHQLPAVAQDTHAGPLLQRQPTSTTEPWLTQIDDILSRKVGLLAHMHRIGQLTDRFTTSQLNELIGLIHADPDATVFTRDYAGVPGSGDVEPVADARVLQREDGGERAGHSRTAGGDPLGARGAPPGR